MKETYTPNIEIPLIDKMHNKALESINENKINIEDFRDTYSDVENDINKTKARMEKWDRESTEKEKEMKKYATILEAITNEFISKGWLGKDVKAKHTADPDDLNGVDIVSEFTKEDPRQYLGLGIDATFAKDLKGKFRGIKAGIVRGKLASVKYYKTEDGQAGLSNIPNVVVGVELKTIKELGEAWVNNDEDYIKNHHIQFQIIDQILMQLDKFNKYSTVLEREEIAEKFKATYDLVERIKKDKIESGRYLNHSKRDLMHSRIEEELDDFLKDVKRTSKQKLTGYSTNDLAARFNN